MSLACVEVLRDALLACMCYVCEKGEMFSRCKYAAVSNACNNEEPAQYAAISRAQALQK
jgi:hypothetical protein